MKKDLRYYYHVTGVFVETTLVGEKAAEGGSVFEPKSVFGLDSGSV